MGANPAFQDPMAAAINGQTALGNSTAFAPNYSQYTPLSSPVMNSTGEMALNPVGQPNTPDPLKQAFADYLKKRKQRRMPAPQGM